jgi:FMN phosphatase YigB (HAD superfamily)
MLNFQVAAKKSNPAIFLTVYEMLGAKLKPEEYVHIGEDSRNHLLGARDAGCDTLFLRLMFLLRGGILFEAIPYLTLKKFMILFLAFEI